MRQPLNRTEMLVLMPERLRRRNLARMKVLRGRRKVRLLLGGRAVSQLPVMAQQLLKVLRAEDRDLGEQQLALHERGRRVVEHGPHGHEVLELAARLLDDAVVALEHNRHAGQVLHLGVAHDEGVDVEATRGEDTGHAGEHTGLVLHETVEDVGFRWCGGGHWCLVED